MPKSTVSRSNREAQRFFVDLGGSMPTASLESNKYGMVYVDDFLHKVFRHLKKKSDAAAMLSNKIAECLPRADLKIGFIRTGRGE